MAALPTEPASAPRLTRSALAPLRRPIFRAMLVASFASNIGTWVQDVGASWLMTSLAPAPVMVSLIQTAVNLPFFLVGAIAGALADITDRRRLLIVGQVWMLLSAGTVGILTVLHLTTPWALLGLSFSLGAGAALSGPAWQAIVPELVERDEVLGAIGLNSVQFNFARGIGPALGGALVSAWGAGAAFLANAASFIGVLGVLATWRRERVKSILPAERLYGGIRAGARFVRYSPTLRAVLIRSLVFALGTSALWAVLPLVARVEFHLDATGYGIVLGFFGVGAAVCGFGLPILRRRLSADWLAMSGGLAFALANATIASTRDVHVLWVATFLAGAAWVATTAMYNSSAQMALPSWVRARALSMYLLTLQGGLAVGSAAWGYLASQVGIRHALDFSALFLIANLLTAMRFSLGGADRFDPKPWVLDDLTKIPGQPLPDQGPVMVNLEFRIDPARAAEFEKAMRALEPIRRRDGAVMWSVFSDITDPSRYVETYVIETWAEHVRQHYRGTASDSEAWKHARSFHIGPQPLGISHLIAPPAQRDSPVLPVEAPKVSITAEESVKAVRGGKLG